MSMTQLHSCVPQCSGLLVSGTQIPNSVRNWPPPSLPTYKFY